MEGVFSVAEVVYYLRDILDEDVLLNGLWIEGEISNLSHSSAGHTYFTLKDEQCQIRCVLFRAAGRAQAATLKHGGHVLTHGRMGVYEAQGSVQLYVDLIQPTGVGALHRRFEELRARLETEGLFDDERKRAIPVLPRCIGLVTSAQGAALQDIRRVLSGRFPAVRVILSPTLVQGEEAAAQIVAAIMHLGTLEQVEVLIVARGGGSLEDLWAFNEEVVARAIAASRVPVITGIGHETDTTIADLVADLRAPTPSAAAMAAVPDREEMLAQVGALYADLHRTVSDRLHRHHAEIIAGQRELLVHSPARRIDQQRQQIDELVAVLQERARHHVLLKAERLRGRTFQLRLLDPRQILARGYAVITTEDGAVIRDAAALTGDDRITIRMRDGMVAAVVTSATSEG